MKKRFATKCLALGLILAMGAGLCACGNGGRMEADPSLAKENVYRVFYKRRDYSRVVNGRNPIVAHEYLGESVEGKDIFVVDDIISSGESMLDIAYSLKKRGANRIFANATYAIFTNGLDAFDKAYADGIIAGVFGTNLTYRTPELLARPWFHEVDVSKYIAYFIAALNHDLSVGDIIDPHQKIKTLLEATGQAR